jgi:hypothetical protein
MARRFINPSKIQFKKIKQFLPPQPTAARTDTAVGHGVTPAPC